MKYHRFLISFLLTIFLILGIQPTLLSQKPNPPEVSFTQGQQAFQQGNYPQAVERLEKAKIGFQDQENWQSLAITLTNLGRLQLTLGEAEKALENFQYATYLHQNQLENKPIEIRRLQIYQGKALQQLGLYSNACETLIGALGIEASTCEQLNPENLAITQAADSIQIPGWHILGDVLRVLGKLEESKNILETIKGKSSSDSEQAATFLSLGNTLRTMGNLERDRQAPTRYDYIPWRCETIPIDEKFRETLYENYYKKALKNYEQGTGKGTLTTQLKANLNRLSLLLELENWQSADELAKNINIEDIPQSQFKIYARINYAKSLTCLNQKYSQEWNSLDNIFSQMKDAVDEAQKLANPDIQAYAIGNLAGLYEYQAWKLNQSENISLKQNKIVEANLQKAVNLTQNALYLSQPSEAPHIAYQWQWQLGRLFKAEGDPEKAIKAYEAAANTLDSVRGDLLAINTDVQFNFRDNVEPLYRQFIQILLKSNQPNQKNLQLALDTIDSLKLAELQNFLNCDLSQETKKSKFQELEQRDKTTAFIYPIILKDKLEIIFKSPIYDKLLHYSIPVHANQLEALINKIQSEQRRKSGKSKADDYGKQFYLWLLKPLELELQKANQVNTLVFLLDGSLRNISLAAIPDEEGKYLIERYAISTIYSRNLTQENFKDRLSDIITAGISQEIYLPEFGRFEALSEVPQELQQVQEVINSQNQPLLDRTFTNLTLKNQIEKTEASILHIATHGRFNSDPNKTFIVAWNELIKAKDFDKILQRNGQAENENFKILVLSACQTAQGDRRATLGLAGISVQAGVDTTLASLWNINDQSTTQFMVEFYKHLATETSLAIALQKTQLDFLNQSNTFNAPYYWSPFIIVGNWVK